MSTGKGSGANGGSQPTQAAPGGPVTDPFAKNRRGPNLDLGELVPAMLVRSLNAVLDTGALLSIGRTSDGGAIGVYLTNNGQRFKEWASTPEELEAIFVSLIEWGESMV